MSVETGECCVGFWYYLMIVYASNGLKERDIWLLVSSRTGRRKVEKMK